MEAIHHYLDIMVEQGDVKTGFQASTRTEASRGLRLHRHILCARVCSVCEHMWVPTLHLSTERLPHDLAHLRPCQAVARYGQCVHT